MQVWKNNTNGRLLIASNILSQRRTRKNIYAIKVVRKMHKN
jgi:hypothetical protein